MSEVEFKPGDLVCLKSGGPNMTVEQVDKLAMTGEPAVWCVWFDKTKKYSDTFSPAALEKTTKPTGKSGLVVRG